MASRRPRRPPRPRERGESFPTFLKVLIPLFIMGIAAFQTVANNGHVDNNVIGALVFIALGGAVGYVADRFIQAWLGIGQSTTLPAPEPEDARLQAGDEAAPTRIDPPRRRKRKSHHGSGG